MTDPEYVVIGFSEGANFDGTCMSLLIMLMGIHSIHGNDFCMLHRYSLTYEHVLLFINSIYILRSGKAGIEVALM